jgi:Domain of unknown function (DUF6371)
MATQHYRFCLDNRRPTRLIYCPQCRKRTFKRYLDTETDAFLPEQVGRCNRESNCAYHYTPKQFFADNPTVKMAESKQCTYPSFTAQEIVQDSFSTIPLPIFEKSKSHYNANNFVAYLKNLFHDDWAAQLIEQFHIGTSKHWQGATVFWQVDSLGNIRTGKIMLYDVVTGKRRKDDDGTQYINWAHTALKTPNFNLQQCLFGEHQLLNQPMDKTIAIVESEKTAILMSALLPQYIWLATGGLHNLKAERCQVLAKRRVILFPDLNAFEKWKAKEAELKQIGCSVITSDLLERHATTTDKTEGYDLADYFIKRDAKVGWALSDTEGYPLFWNTNFI